MTLKEWITAHPGAPLDGVVLHIPKKHQKTGAPAKAALRSVWGMGDLRGLWVCEPGQAEGRVWPVTGIDPNDLMAWTVEP